MYGMVSTPQAALLTFAILQSNINPVLFFLVIVERAVHHKNRQESAIPTQPSPLDKSILESFILTVSQQIT